MIGRDPEYDPTDYDPDTLAQLADLEYDRLARRAEMWEGSEGDLDDQALRRRQFERSLRPE